MTVMPQQAHPLFNRHLRLTLHCWIFVVIASLTTHLRNYSTHPLKALGLAEGQGVQFIEWKPTMEHTNGKLVKYAIIWQHNFV